MKNPIRFFLFCALLICSLTGCAHLSSSPNGWSLANPPLRKTARDIVKKHERDFLGNQYRGSWLFNHPKVIHYQVMSIPDNLIMPWTEIWAVQRKTNYVKYKIKFIPEPEFRTFQIDVSPMFKTPKK